MWLRKSNIGASSTKSDDRPEPVPVQHDAAPVRSSASALLSGAQIWSTASAPSTPGIVKPREVISPPAPQPADAAPAEAVVSPTLPQLSPADIKPVVAEIVLSGTEMHPATIGLKPTATEVTLAVTSDPSLAALLAPIEAQVPTVPQLPFAPAPRSWPPRKLSLALQGGGTLSAFNWGVLERLLEEPGCDFDSISGASAGAVHAALLASGLARGGREGARDALARFWLRITSEASYRSLMLVGAFSSAGSAIALSPALSSGRFDPFDLDPLRDMLMQHINFAAVQSPAAPRLLLAATRVRDGSQQIFRNADITPDSLLASLCPPHAHCSVEIDGEAYWDGGYGANPPIVSLVHESSAADLLVVQPTPARDNYVPVTPAAVDRRLDQITANAVLNAEIAALEWARSDGLHPPRVHRLAAEDAFEGLAQRSAADLGLRFIATLRQSGRNAAEAWLQNAPEGTTLVVAEPRPAFPSEDVLDGVMV